MYSFYCITQQVSSKTMTQSFLDRSSFAESRRYAMGFCVFQSTIKVAFCRRAQKAFGGSPKDGRGEESPNGFQTVLCKVKHQGIKRKALQDQCQEGPFSPPTLSLCCSVFYILNESAAQIVFETPLLRGGQRSTVSMPPLLTPKQTC